MLEDEADLALLHGYARRVGTPEDDLAGIGRFETGDEAQKRRLSGA
jgi:hypothetical protein